MGGSLWPTLFDFGALHLKLLSLLGKVHSPARDHILKLLIKYSEEEMKSELRVKMTDELVKLAKTYNAQQILIKIVFDNAQRDAKYYDVLHEQIAVWGRDFLLLAMRVVYILEKRKVEQLEAGQAEDQYQGFQMIDIFAGKYYEELKEFYRIVNPNMMGVLIATKLKDLPEGPERSQQADVVCNILLSKVSSIEKNLEAERSLAAMGKQVVEVTTTTPPAAG